MHERDRGRHLDRLTAVDASFLSNEKSNAHMHVGALLIFEGPPPNYTDLVEHVRSRLALVPRFRQKLVVPPLEMGRPLWADDVNFNLTYHIRHTALPSPGGEAQLKRLTARIFSQQLDRSKPLWELWLAQGLERDRFAILTKTHHAMVDGISGVDIGTVLFDFEAVPEPVEIEDDWVPQPPPGTAELVARGVSDAVSLPINLAQRAVDAVRHPETTARKAAEAFEGLSEIAGAFADPAPDVPLNQPIGPHRRYVWTSSELATFKRIKDGLGGTSTTSCSRPSPARCATGCSGAGCGPRARAAGAGAGLDPGRGRARQPRQPDRADARPTAGLRRGARSQVADDQRRDGRPQALQTGAGGGSDLALQRLRAADPARPGLADQLLDPALQRDRHQRTRAAAAALRAGARTPGRLPGRLPAENHALAIAIMSYNGRSASACWPTTTRWRTSK